MKTKTTADNINITVNFLHDDKQYQGVTLHNGVGLNVVDDLCIESLTFSNTTNPPKGILLQGVSAVVIDSLPHRPYLQLKPTVVPIASAKK